jgi:cytochrome P450
VTDPVEDDLVCDEAVDDPQTFFGRIRERTPLYWNERHRSWLLTRYDDVVRAYRNPALSSARTGPLEERPEMADAAAVLRRWMVFTDPPDHTRLRRACALAFAPRRIARLEPRIGELVEGLLDPLHGPSHADLITDLAAPLPALVIAELLGVPSSDRVLFTRWSHELTTLLFGSLDIPDRHERGRAGLLALRDYLADAVADRARTPRDDLVSVLVRDGTLQRDEVVSTSILLLFAGHETTSGLLGNALLALLTHPDQLDLLREHPELVEPGIEELLRYDGPAKLSPRRVVEDVALHGDTLRAGDRVLLVHASANRDPRRFCEPDRLLLARSDNPHLGFGYGVHYCLGAPLARLETRIALTATLRRLRLEPGPAKPAWQRSLLGRALRSLPVTVGA